MSAETRVWLNQRTLQSGNVWHTDAELQKLYNTIYPGAIPVEDVRRRLFNWKAVEGTVMSTGTVMNEEGVQSFTVTDPNRKTMMRPPGALGPDDEGEIMGVFKSGYQGHDYEKWLLDVVAEILGDELGIYSAGLLRMAAQAWVQVTIPDVITTPEGVTFRPNLLAVTSFDGSLATCFKRTASNTVCDNTMHASLGSVGETYRVKHSKYSNAKIIEAREALAMVHTMADDFAAQVAELTSIKVSAGDWDKFLNEIAPTTDEHAEPKKGRALTMATNKRGEMNQLWNHDQRVAPWKNTVYGVVQAVNTHAHHIQTVRGAERAERNMQLAVTGGFDKLDTQTLDTIMAVVA